MASEATTVDFTGGVVPIAAESVGVPSLRLRLVAWQPVTLIAGFALTIMPRRRFPLRLHHSDTLLMLLAVLTATAFCWVVLSLTQRNQRQAVAYTVFAPDVRLPTSAAGQLLKQTHGPGGQVTANLVATDAGVSVGVVAASDSPADLEAAKSLADRIAQRLRATDWSVVHRLSSEETAERLYALDVRIRDAATQRRRSAATAPSDRLDAALVVGRLLRERAEVLAAAKPTALSGPLGEVEVIEHTMDPHSEYQRPFALGLFALMALAVVLRLWLGGPGRASLARVRASRPAQAIRPLHDLKFEAPPLSKAA